MESTQLEVLVAGELAKIKKPELVDAIRALLVPPRCELRAWDYEKQNQSYRCWIILELRDSNVCIAFCEEGFGPSHPWGLLFKSGPHMDMGMNSQWYRSLEEAYLDS